jgi:hypothetical protein
MKKNDIAFSFVLLFLSAYQLTAQDTAEVMKTDDVKKLLSMIVANQNERIKQHSYNHDEILELRKLYLRYFQTEESLRFDKNTYFGERLSEFVNYIISDDGAIRVVSWYTTLEKSSDYDSIVQFRDSSGKLKTASIPQMEKKFSDSYYYYDFFPSFFYEIYKLKKDVYLLVGVNCTPRYETIHFLTLELRKDEVVFYFAFKDNNMTISVGGSVFGPEFTELNYLPQFLDVQIIPQPGSFAIELDMLFPKDHLNMYEWVNDYNIMEEETFKHKEKFVFNGTEFVGNYWVLDEYWSKGERPEDISQFFPKFIKRAKQQDNDEAENTSSSEAEITFDVSNPSEEAENITPQTDKKKNHFPLFILPLFTAVLICGIYYQKKLMRKLSLRKKNFV